MRANFFFGNPEGKRPVGRPRRRCEDIKMYFMDIAWEVID
jgi:hypothetical protein